MRGVVHSSALALWTPATTDHFTPRCACARGVTTDHFTPRCACACGVMRSIAALCCRVKGLTVYNVFAYRQEAYAAVSTVTNRAFACILLPWKWQPFWCTASIDFHCAPKWPPWWLPSCCYAVTSYANAL